MLRASLLYLSQADWARQVVIDFPPSRLAARRFVAGETLDEALGIVRQLNLKGMSVTLDHLGENVTSEAEAADAAGVYQEILKRIAESGLDSTISIKLTALGLDFSDAICIANVIPILERARQHHNGVTIDMESSAYTERTLRIYRALRDEHGFDNVGIVIQAYLFRSEDDMRALAAEGARVRLCKGAYQEPPSAAFPEKRRVDDNFASLCKYFLNPTAVDAGAYLEVATHDARMVEAARYHAREGGVRADQYEFQMLYGVRTRLQERLIAEGHHVRLYVPYGTQWYPYYMRRLAERPANLWFFLSNFLQFWR